MLPQLSYQEAAEMAIFGAKAMHPRALGPVSKENIPVRIRSSFHSENPGTLITKEPTADAKAIKAVAMMKDVAMINVAGAAMVGAPGSYAKVFDVLGKNNINVMMISTAVSEANISMIIKRGMLGRAISNLEIALLERGGLISEVTAEDDVAVIAVMGAYMKGTLGLASKIFATVAKKGINIRMIAQGSSELNISFVVKEKDGVEVVKAIHEEFGLDKP
jgi:aspartate kinase